MLTEQEVINKVTDLVVRKWNGDFKVAFDESDSDKDGKLSVEDIEVVLEEAGINFMRSAIARTIVNRLDTNGDSHVEWTEFDATFRKPMR